MQISTRPFRMLRRLFRLTTTVPLCMSGLKTRRFLMCPILPYIKADVEPYISEYSANKAMPYIKVA